MSKVLLSVLIPTFPPRLSTMLELVTELDRQMIPGVTELIYLGDNGSMPIGTKMNHMIGMASGRFVSGVGDDDWVVPGYVESIVKQIEKTPDADVILFDIEHWAGKKYRGVIRLGKDYLNLPDEPGKIRYRNPSDEMAWSREFRLALPCSDTWATHAEDFSEAANDLIQHESRIESPLYIHRWEPSGTFGKRHREKLDREYAK